MAKLLVRVKLMVPVMGSNHGNLRLVNESVVSPVSRNNNGAFDLQGSVKMAR